MPLVGIKCEKHGEMSFEEVLSGKCDCTPRVIIDSILEIARADYHKDDVITATSCLGCLRETYLSRTCDYYASISQLYYSWRGTLIHNIVERPELANWVAEERYSKTLMVGDKAIEISGKIDGYDLKEQTLHDFKTIGDKGMAFIIKSGAKEDHISQVNIYKWLCPHKIKKLGIIYLSMMNFIQTGTICEVSQSFKNTPDKSKHGFEYFIPPVKRNSKGWGTYRLFYNVPDVPIWSDDEVKNYLTPKAEILYNAFKDNILPPMCDEETRRWKCESYCNVKHICDKIEKESANGKRPE